MLYTRTADHPQRSYSALFRKDPVQYSNGAAARALPLHFVLFVTSYFLLSQYTMNLIKGTHSTLYSYWKWQSMGARGVTKRVHEVL